jgi:predicted transcriptional regulator
MPFSARSKKRFVQKAFWLPKDVARRLDKVIRKRKKGQPEYTERIAMSLAVREFVAREEVELGIAKAASVAAAAGGRASSAG